MFQTMRKVTLIGPAVFVGNLVLVLFCFGAGVALIPRATSATGLVGALLLPACGVLLVLALISAIARTRAAAKEALVRFVPRDGELAWFFPRDHGLVWWLGALAPGVLGLWAIGMAVAGAISGIWIWVVLMLPTAAFFCALPLQSLTGRITPGGVWITPSRLIDEQPSLVVEVQLSDLASAFADGGGILLTLGRADAVTVTRTSLWGGWRTRKDILLLAGARTMVVTSPGTAWEQQVLGTIQSRTAG